MKLYRDINVRLYGSELCDKVDTLRQKGINLTELIKKAINDYGDVAKHEQSNKV
jgi:hypothetical protein